jgi:hypothetical protein
MFNKVQTLNDELTKLVGAQNQLIDLYRDTIGEREEIISHLKRLVNLQEEQIVDLKLKLRELREKQ